MTLISSLIQAGHREDNLIPVGSSPTTAEAAEGLLLFNSLLNRVFGSEMGEELTDWPFPSPQRTAPVAANYPQLPYPNNEAGGAAPILSSAIYPYPPANSRIVFGNVAGKLYFPEQPNPGARMALVQGTGAGDGGVGGATITLDGNGRTIETLSTKAFSQPIAARQWFYREDLGDWQVVTTLLASDQCPFPPELDDLWITGLSMRLAPRFGKTTSQNTKDTFVSNMKTLKTRYRQSGVTVYGSSEFPRSLQSYISGRWQW